MIKDPETNGFTSEAEEKWSQSSLMLKKAVSKHTHTHKMMLKLCVASQQICGNKDMEELILWIPVGMSKQ